jgi:DNA-damage-inducible protein D
MANDDKGQEGAQATPFERIKHVDDQGVEYWSARELAKALEYVKWDKFLNVLDKAIVSCENSGQEVDDHFLRTEKIVPIGKGGQRHIRDLHLSRYACYLVAQNADPEKVVVAQAQTYFAVQTRRAELTEEVRLRLLQQRGAQDPLVEVMERIKGRQELTAAHKRLLAEAKDAGIITPFEHAVFMNSGYEGLYGGETEDDIHARKGLKPNQSISSFMGGLETTANIMRAEIAARRLHRLQQKNPDIANKTHYEAGKAVREFLIENDIYPEQLETPTKSYEQIVKEEARRIALEEAYEQGLWGQLQSADQED